MADSDKGNGRGHEAGLVRAQLKRELALATNSNQRLDVLISHPKCESLIPTLPAEDLYVALRRAHVSLREATNAHEQ